MRLPSGRIANTVEISARRQAAFRHGAHAYILRHASPVMDHLSGDHDNCERCSNNQDHVVRRFDQTLGIDFHFAILPARLLKLTAAGICVEQDSDLEPK
jgi:hypothetical protein